MKHRITTHTRLHQQLFFFLFGCFLLMGCSKERFITDPGTLLPKTVDQNPQLPSIEINGAKLHAEAFGPADSTLIVCIHGGPGGDYRYLLNCKSLASKGYRVVFYDQRGSGLSERFPKDWYTSQGSESINRIFYDELKAVINHYKTHSSQKVILLGQSWGAILATGYTGKYPEEIYGLILGEPGGLKWDDITSYVRESRSFGLWSEALNDATFLDQFLTGRENQHEILDYKLTVRGVQNEIVGDIAPDLRNNAPTYVASRSGAVINATSFELGKTYRFDFSAGINNYGKKVLFFYSSKNRAYPDSWATKISAAYNNKELIKVQGVGHSGMFDQYDTWTNFTEEKIIDYLKSL